MCGTRRLRISAANIGPNRFHQNRTVSWLMSIPRSANRSSTLRSDSGYRTYIITTVVVQTLEVEPIRGLEVALDHAASTAFQISGAVLCLTRNLSSLN